MIYAMNISSNSRGLCIKNGTRYIVVTMQKLKKSICIGVDGLLLN